MKYQAIKRGFDGIVVREVGAVFEFEGKPGSWMKPVEEGAPAVAPVKEDRPPSKKLKEKDVI